MPSLLKRTNGVYYLVTSRRGKRIWRSIHTRVLADAEQVLEEAQREKKLSFMTIQLFAGEFLERSALTLAEKTISMYDQAFTNWIRICGNRQLKFVRPLDIERFKIQRSREVSPVSANIELRSLRAAFAEAQRLRLIEENPFDGVRQLRVPFKEAKHLSQDEFSRLLNCIPDVQFKNLLQFAVFTIMRLGEISHLQWSSVDLDRREIHVRSHDEFRVKGDRPRIVPMSPWVFSFLSSRLRVSEFVFPNKRGFILDGRAISRRFKRHVMKAGLDPAIHFHSLRHTGISWLINKGVPPQFVQRIAGHRSLRVTEVYTHLEDKNLISAVNAFGSIISN